MIPSLPSGPSVSHFISLLPISRDKPRSDKWLSDQFLEWLPFIWQKGLGTYLHTALKKQVVQCGQPWCGLQDVREVWLRG